MALGRFLSMSVDVAHWTQGDNEPLLDWSDAHWRLQDSGRPSKVQHPTADQLAFLIAPLGKFTRTNDLSLSTFLPTAEPWFKGFDISACARRSRPSPAEAEPGEVALRAGMLPIEKLDLIERPSRRAEETERAEGSRRMQRISSCSDGRHARCEILRGLLSDPVCGQPVPWLTLAGRPCRRERGRPIAWLWPIFVLGFEPELCRCSGRFRPACGWIPIDRYCPTSKAHRSP